MKRKYIFTGVLLTVLLIASVLVVQLADRQQENEQVDSGAAAGTLDRDELRIVTSFYPVYTAVTNIVQDAEGVIVTNLTDQTIGCLHDYQLTTEDMTALAEADVFVINGGGMESYMAHVITQFPELVIINASDGIELLADDGTTETEAEHEKELSTHHDHSHEINAHVWMSIEKYMQQIDNITAALSQADPERSKLYSSQAAGYLEDLAELQTEAEVLMEQASSRNIIIFHDSFAYFADEYGLEISYMIEMDEETTLSAGEVAELIDVIERDSVEVLFAEEQYGTKIAETVAAETEAEVYLLDSLVTGDYSRDNYLTGMRYNLEVLKEALCQ